LNTSRDDLLTIRTSERNHEFIRSFLSPGANVRTVGLEIDERVVFRPKPGQARERIEELLLRRSYVAGAYEERLTALAAYHGGGGEDGLLIPTAEHGSERRSWFVYVVQLPVSIDRENVISSLAEQGIPSKAYLPCLHLFPHLRELGYREGQFPIAERAGARSLGLPFFTSMREGQVDQVCEAFAAALTQSMDRSSTTS
jgi:dTDP-4-amino-4,6-dideoxygalactose transaminase